LADRALEAWCFGELAGTVTDTTQGLTFVYAQAWVDARRPPLSQSLPLTGAFDDSAARAFFGGLLPEGNPREVLARQLGVSRDNDFSMLDALGGDTAGAVSLIRPGTRAPSAGNTERVVWLDEQELAAEIRELPARPMHADEDGEYRLSLAGTQDKLPVVVGPDGRVGLTRGGTPSTHIMKTPIPHLENTVANEAMCLDLGRRLGIPTVEALPRRATETECLLVARYDREVHAGGVVSRLHQEDFCQALGIAPERKYQAEGGPGLTDCFALIRRASTVPARDAVRMLDYLVLGFLVANHDAHGKNYSLVYGVGGTDLAPAYDVLCTFVHRGALRMSPKMAMSIGTEYRPPYVRARHFDALLQAAGLGPAAARRRVADLATRAPDHALAARAALAQGGWDAPVLGRIVDTVADRATWLAEVVRVGQVGRPAAGGGPQPDPPRVLRELSRSLEISKQITRELRDLARELQDVTGRMRGTGSGEAGPGSLAQDDDRGIAADVRRIDAAVDDINAQVKLFARGIWEFIEALEAGRASMQDPEELMTLLRELAAETRAVINLLATAAEGVGRLDDLDPAMGILASALGRLRTADVTFAEWDARLQAHGVPPPSAQ
jgi:serine/threonine-protein kinase HipA